MVHLTSTTLLILLRVHTHIHRRQGMETDKLLPHTLICTVYIFSIPINLSLLYRKGFLMREKRHHRCGCFIVKAHLGSFNPSPIPFFFSSSLFYANSKMRPLEYHGIEPELVLWTVTAYRTFDFTVLRTRLKFIIG